MLALMLTLPLTLVASPPSAHAECGNGAGGFGSWLTGFKKRAAAAGISSATIAASLDGVAYDPRIIRLDRNQRSFKLSFEAFYARRVGGALIARGRARLQKYRATLDRIERSFGVPAEVVIAIWGLETNYGADTGSK